MRTRLFLSFVVVVVTFVLLTVIQRNSAITDAQASLLSAQNSDAAYIESQQTSDLIVFGVIASGAIVLVAIWADELRKLFVVAFVMFLMLVFTACAPATRDRTVLTQPNQVTFVIQARGDNTNQVAVGSTPLTADEAYWRDNMVNKREITISQYCFYAYQGAACTARDAVLVITVDTTPVNIEWIADAIVEGEPRSDQVNAFSMQSLEPDGGSTGVYVGAQLIARIAPEDAALYLASYGHGVIDSNGVYPARPLRDVLATEVRAFIQTELNNEYGNRSVIEQNRDMEEMFTNVRNRLVETFGTKGIAIDSFGYRDGNVYENPVIQTGIDSAFERQRQQDEAESNATRQAIVDMQLINSAYAQATATMVSAQSAAAAQQLQAEVLRENPDLVELEAVRRWDGHLPQIIGDSNAIPMVPFALETPPPAPTPTPQP
ncbi:MAG: hypothetical protein US96_C0007G0031 [Candidatus Woesebacteria bacterium GW2011_GWB1_38_5b]|uniref:Band 7 domain-containing protein n=1 Tax=Candidatus Woesebacteria bacterium GW2011_GWB1_38_5b TaxID=1618569 RepID=A0A0G0K7Q4_9BACT|nr:MAG: hypothetical protein US96_C0007G0031 [Candidatus Woesebacteria bacterium GW2011_GWB1_38_5b]